MWELFTQAGPVVNVYLPKDRVTNAHQGYGFVEFRGEEDADYAIKVLNMIKVFAKPIRVNKASQDKKILDVGANLFIGNLDIDVDEKVRLCSDCLVLKSVSFCMTRLVLLVSSSTTKGLV
mgnify:CR=1 FL=1